jgi:hypothetical protein
MKKLILFAIVLMIIFAGLSSCRSLFGRGSGPLDSFILLSSRNPGLSQDVIGLINRKADPKRIELVLPPGIDMRNLVASLALNTEAVITVISTGNRIVQRNGISSNDFSVPVTYSIEVPGEDEGWHYLVSVREADQNARLGNLILPEGYRLNPAFSPDIAAYTAEVPYATRGVRVEARGESRYLKSISIGGVASRGSAGVASVDFQSGQERTVVIETVAEDGFSRQSYTIILKRGEPDRNNILADLSIPGSGISPSFAADRRSYTVDVPFSTREIPLIARTQSRYASVTLTPAPEGARTDAFEYKGDPASTRGALIAFAQGNNLSIVVSVTAQDGSERRYALVVRRSAPDSNSFLSSLSVAGGVLNPRFSSRVASYSVRLPAAVERVRLSAIAASPLANVIIADRPGERASANRTIDIAVAHGQRKVVTFIVAAEDSSQRLYRVSVIREAAPVVVSPPVTDETAAVSPPVEDETVAVSPPVVVDTPVTDETTPAAPPIISSTVEGIITVEAKGLRLEPREAEALTERGLSIGERAMITVRYYRSNEVILKDSASVRVRKQGKTYAVTLDYRSNRIPMNRGRLIEVEVAIATEGGHNLHYTEAILPDDEIRIELPFLLFGQSPRVTWPGIGTPVKVIGYLSLLPPGKDPGVREADSGDFEKNAKGEYGIVLEITDPSSGRLLGREEVWSRPGIPRGHTFSFEEAIELPEGSTVRYAFTARARNGRVWQAAGTARVWTTKLAYDAGFMPVLFFLVDDLMPAY